MIVIRDRRTIVRLVAKEAKGGLVVIHADNVGPMVTKLGAIPTSDKGAVIKLPRDFGRTYAILYTIFEQAGNQQLKISVYANRKESVEKVADIEYMPEAKTKEVKAEEAKTEETKAP